MQQQNPDIYEVINEYIEEIVMTSYLYEELQSNIRHMQLKVRKNSQFSINVVPILL